MKHVGIFSGSFNPIHNGHIALASYIREKCGLDEVWLSVSPNNPLKDAGTLLDENLRYMLARDAVAHIEGLRAINFEFSLPRPSYTINLLRALSETYTDTLFALIIGSDNMLVFDQWYCWKDILLGYRVIVYPRGNDNLSELSRKYPQMEVLQEAPKFDISSTQIRKLYRTHGDLSEIVPNNVEKLLENKKNLWE